MHLTLLQAQLLCCALLACDLCARAERIRLLLRGVGHRIGFVHALVVNSIGDAASALTPLRFAGEPARFAAILREGIPLRVGFVALGYEVAVEWPVTAATAFGLYWLWGRSWWGVATPTILRRAAALWPWFAIALGASAFALYLGWPRVRAARRRTLGLIADTPRPLWHMRWQALLAAAPLTFVSIAARVAVLPVLALTLRQTPPLGAVALGSFALLYGQLLLPTPSGLGAVELAFLGGAVGDLGPHPAGVLLYWRVYTSGLGALIGGVLALRVYGVSGLAYLMRRVRRGRVEPSPEHSGQLAQDLTPP
jgi:uncharacterized membrane protein YbhN (UPF0104 family)